MFGVPWFEWLTLDEMVAMGHSRFWCEIVLPNLYREGTILAGCRLVVRPRSDLPDSIRVSVAERGFERDTVRYYEFKFTSQLENGQKWWQKSRVEILQPMPLYASNTVVAANPSVDWLFFFSTVCIF